MARPSAIRLPVLLVTVLALLPLPLAAQDRDATRVWLGVGLTQGASAEVEAGAGGLAQLTWQRGRHHAALRALGLTDIAGFPDGGSDNSVAELGLLYGRTRSSSWGHLAWAGSLSLLHLDGCGEDAPDACTAIGVPVTAEAAIQTGVAGLGLQLYGNVNTRTPFAGLALFVQLGWMP